MVLEVGDFVLCTVDRIVGTVVFVKIDNNGEGSIITSEIAPGRIRNLREYVVPKKRIVCKILRISPNGNVDLSLRRVTQKEKKEVLEQDKQEKSYISILKSIFSEKTEEIIREISKTDNLFDFLQNAKENPKKLEKIAGKEKTQKILDIIKIQKQKKAIIKKEIFLTTTKPNGLSLIKEILGNLNGVEVKYISAGKYSLKTEANEPKTADNRLKESLKEIEEKAKKSDIKFSIKEK